MKEIILEFENELIKTSLTGKIAVLEIKQDVFSLLTNISEGFIILNWINALKSKKEIKGLLIEGSSDLYTKIHYENFLELITNKENDSNKLNIVDNLNRESRAKQINLLNSFTRTILECPKLVFTVLRGVIATPFIGLALASDLRIGTKDTKFAFFHKSYGLHPTGALPFFLSSFLGYSKARNILFTKKELTYDELVKLNIIDKTIESKSQNEAEDYVSEILSENGDSIISTKYLNNKILLDQYNDFMNTEEKMVLS